LKFIGSDCGLDDYDIMQLLAEDYG